MENESWSLEQAFLLQRVRLEAEAMDRSALIEALCDAWAARFRLKHAFASMSRDAGYLFHLEERRPWRPPETEADFEAALGYVPDAAERAAYLRRQWETATMALDMDAIVLTPDDD